MSLLDLTCQNSVSSSKDCCHIDRKKECLCLGNNYQIYLSFNLPASYSCLRNLQQARLILFKIPTLNSENQTIKGCNSYSIYPLLDFFSIYSCLFTPPKIDYSKREKFQVEECSSYTDVDITSIVKAWINQEIENKGLVLIGNNDSVPITYASDRNKIKGLRPILRLIYEDINICLPLSMTPSAVAVENLT